MMSEKVVAIVALVWLFSSVLLMARLIRRGRKLVSVFEANDPETYETMGRPRPGFFESARRRRFSQFLARREYLKLTDAELADEFESYRKAENRLLASVLVTLGIVAALIFWVSRGTQ